MSRQELREQARRIRKEQSLGDVKPKSLAIWNRLSMTPEYRCKTIAFYVSLAGEKEVDTIPMISSALLQGKRVCVPKVVADGLRFFEIKSLEYDLQVGSFGILEPIGGKEILPPQVELMIVPGVAFDRDGNRLGFGKGYYDRFLPKLRNKTPIIALAFDFQVIDKVPSMIGDIRVHKIVTESRTISCVKDNKP